MHDAIEGFMHAAKRIYACLWPFITKVGGIWNNDKQKYYIGLFTLNQKKPFGKFCCFPTFHSLSSCTGQFTKKVFSDLADGFNIALVDCSANFSLLSTSIVYTFELQQSPNQTNFPSISCVLLFSQNCRPLQWKYLFRETPCILFFVLWVSLLVSLYKRVHSFKRFT